MASTIEGARITEQHRRAQLLVRSSALDDMLRIWPALDSKNPLAGWPAVERAALAVIHDRRQESVNAATLYLQDFRTAEIGASRAVQAVASTDELVRAATVALRVTGPLTAIRLAEQKAADPLATAFVRVTGAVSRLVLNGGRETIERFTRNDEQSLGWARTVSGRACYFCAMLASRGPVYREATVSFRAHDHCACGMEPVYRRGAEWPPRAREFQELWRTATRGTSGQESVIAFRHAYDAIAA